ncbi:MAG TPA: hypothetical protein DEH78_01600 [Solibacterales bacterium]|nr:hypothetical protein [Bryobacterales bacterium]
MKRLLCLFFALCLVAVAQSNYGSIRGQVTDSTGAAIVGANVEIKNIGTNATLKLTTNEEGFYVAATLPPVEYEVKVSTNGFQTTVISPVKVDTAQISTVNASLKPGSVSEQVTVTGEAPLLQTYSGAVQQTVDQRTINEMPLNGRNTLELALTLPGVAGSAGTEFSELTTNEPVPGRELAINGGRVGSTQFQADGANVTSIALGRMSIAFTPDTIQEFSVQQANYSAQFAQAGGAIIQQTTKSGTNDLRGTVFWFHRQKAFTANPFDSQRSPTTNFDNRPPLRRQQLGAVLTGPVMLPKIYKGKDRTFFMFSFEPTRQLSSNPGGPSFIRVPTERELNGDFSQTMVYFRNANGTVRSEPTALLYNQFVRRSDGTLQLRANPNFNPNLPASATNFTHQYRAFPLFNPNDSDPARRGRVLVDERGQSLVNPVTQRIARELYPAPNITDPGVIADLLGANYSFFRSTQYSDDRYTVKIDHNLTDGNRLSARWTEQPQYGNRRFRDVIQHGLISDANLARQLLATLTSTPRPTMTNEFRANYVYGNFGRNFPEQLLGKDYANEYMNVGGPGVGRVNLLGYGMPRFYDGGSPFGVSGQASGSSFEALGFAQPQDVGKNTEHSYSLTNDFSWVRGAMTWKFGFSASHLQLNQSALGVGSLVGGRYFWDRAQTAEQNCATNPLGGVAPDCAAQVFGGDKFASFLLGVPTGVQVQTENLAVPYYYRWLNLGGYAQNDWRVKSNLTLNIGLRWQYQSPRWEKFNRQGQLNLDRLEPNPFLNNLPAPVFEYAGIDGRSRYLTPSVKDVFEPRFGFAWTPKFGESRLVIRGGYGMVHGVLMGNDREPVPNLGSQTATGFRQISYLLGANDLNSPGNVPSCGLARCNDPSVPMQFGFNNPVLAPDDTLFRVPASGVIRPGDRAEPNASGQPRQNVLYQSTGVIGNKNFRMPTTHNWSLQVERQFFDANVVRVTYQGSRSHHLFGPSPNLNRLDQFTGRFPYPGFAGRFSGGIFLLDPTNTNAVYNALIVEVERRFARGLQFRFNYTRSRALDNSSGGIRFPIPNNSFNNSGLDVGILRNQNPYDVAQEWSISSTNTPNILNFVALWDLPFGRGKTFLKGGGWKEHFIGGWNVNGLARMRNGAPIAVPLGLANSFDIGIPGGSLRPDMIQGVPIVNPDWTRENSWRGVPYINPRAFAFPEPGRYGNAPRNLDAYHPWVSNFDLSLFKRIRPFENDRRFFELRVEVFNVLNMKQYVANPNISAVLGGANQHPLLTGTSPNFVPVANVRNRYAALRSPGVWDAIINKAFGTPVDTAIAQLPGPGANGLGCPANAAELTASNQTNSLSPACTARALNLGGLGRMNANSIQPRIFQFALKFYF